MSDDEKRKQSRSFTCDEPTWKNFNEQTGDTPNSVIIRRLIRAWINDKISLEGN